MSLVVKRLPHLATLFPLFIVGLLALITWWIQYTMNRETQNKVPTQHDRPDTLVKQFTVSAFNPQGERTLQLQGSTLTHFPLDDSAEVTDATIKFLRAGQQSTWRSNTAWATPNDNLLKLEGKVRGERVTDKSNSLTVLTTEHLELNTLDEVASTAHPLHISQARAEIDAQGGSWDNVRGLLKLGPSDMLLTRPNSPPLTP